MLCRKLRSYNGSPPVPCGSCTPCRVSIRRLWAHRIVLESRVHSESCFLTLTYDDDNLPKDFSLDPSDHRNFMKRFRKELPVGSLRYLGVGEYGGKLYDGSGDREINPHYHYALFGFNCLGAIRYPDSGRRCWCVRCELVRRVWGKGNIVIEPLNIKTANYISGYVLKKMTKVGDERLGGRYPEFKRASNGGGKSVVKGGIGAPATKFISDALFNSFTGEIFIGDDVPTSLQVERVQYPLGRYLRSKVREQMGLEKATPKGVLQSYKAELWDMFFDAGGYKEFTSLNDFLMKKNTTKALMLEQRLQFFQKGKSL